MGHDKELHDGKKNRIAGKSLKEKRTEKKSKVEPHLHLRNRPRWKKEIEGA